MNESTTNLTPHFTGSASLAAIGVKIRQLDLLAPIRKLVQIPQKAVKDTPFEKVGSVAKKFKPISIEHRITATEAFLRKRGAAFACFTLIRFSSMHHFDGLKFFATLPLTICRLSSASSSFSEKLFLYFHKLTIPSRTDLPSSQHTSEIEESDG